MNILAIVGLAILTAVLATLMRRYHKEYAMLLSVLGGGLILFMIFQKQRRSWNGFHSILLRICC